MSQSVMGIICGVLLGIAIAAWMFLPPEAAVAISGAEIALFGGGLFVIIDGWMRNKR